MEKPVKPGLFIVRVQNNLTREQLSVKANVSTRTIYKAEKGQPIRLMVAYRLCQALGIDLSDIDIQIVEQQ